MNPKIGGMSLIKVEKLTIEQESKIPFYVAEWKAIALSTQPIDHQKAEEAVKIAYAAIGKKAPNIIFCDSPYVALKTVLSQLNSQPLSELGKQLGTELETKLQNQIINEVAKQLDSTLETQLRRQLVFQLMTHLESQLWSQLGSQLESKQQSQLWKQLRQSIQPELWAGFGAWLNFSYQVLNCDRQLEKWQAFQLLVKNCGWIFPYEKICIVCDRPLKLSFDREQRLHAEANPAIQFADGYSLYAYHGVRLPEKYGGLHPNQWQPQWLLQEWNLEIRRVLIEGIGYARIAQELQAIELDYWQEYTLLKIEQPVDVEPIYLLKMICPSTGYVYALRVPPNMKSAREAITWANWGTDPEEFSVQT